MCGKVCVYCWYTGVGQKCVYAIIWWLDVIVEVFVNDRESWLGMTIVVCIL